MMTDRYMQCQPVPRLAARSRTYAWRDGCMLDIAIYLFISKERYIYCRLDAKD
jgi:hypothetical protein